MDVYEMKEPTVDYTGIVRTEHEKPSPDPDEVLVRIRACSINYRDLAIGNSDLIYPRVEYPVVPLSDGAGEVVALGENVDEISIGDRVTAPLAPDWVAGPSAPEKHARLRGSTIDGMLAQFVTLPAESTIPLPDHLSFEKGAALPCAGLTAWRALLEDGNLHAGQTVLALGTGGVSTFVLQFTEMHGARTIITSSSDEKLARASERGAWETINYEKNPEWGETVMEITDGEGVDHVVEVGGPGTLQRSLGAVRPNGYIHLIGVLTGPSGNIDPKSILQKGVTVEGIMGAGSQVMFERMVRAIDATRMMPVIDRTFRFDEVREAFHYAESGDHQGKVIVGVE